MLFENKTSKTPIWFISNPKITGALVSFLLMLIFGYLIKMRYEILKKNERQEMSNLITVAKQNLEQSIKNSTTTAISLALTLNDEGIPEHFDEVSKQLIHNNPYIDVVELLPNGIIKYVYPLKGNESAINYNILATPEQKEEAEKTIYKKELYFAGPLALKQGDTGIIGRLPVFKHGKFWGFASVIIKLKTLENTIGLNQLKGKNYYLQFSKIDSKTNKEVYFFPIKKDFKKSNAVSVSIPEGNWKLYLVNSDQNKLFFPLIPVFVLGMLLSLLCGYLIKSLLEKTKKLTELTYKQANEISNTELKFKTIFNQAPIGIVQINSSTGEFIEVNKQFSNIIEYSEEEIKQMSLKYFTHEDDIEEDLSKMQELLSGQIRRFSMQKKYISKSGKLIWANLTVAALWKTGKKPTSHIAIVEDITAQKQAEKELHDSFDLVTEQNKRLLNFSYIVSHNLRSHTSNINTISDLLENEENQEERNELLLMLKKVSTSLNETMSKLNEVINIQSNINLTIEKIGLKEYIESCKCILSEQIAKKNAQITNQVDESIIVKYNPAYLESILLNFISNAIKYSHPERQPLISLDYDKRKKELKISDNGLGIDLEKHGESLFGMYKTFHKNEDSRGIGLFIAKNQIEAMGGKVSVESKVNQGTTFTISFK